MNNVFITSAAAASKAVDEAEWPLDTIETIPVDLLKAFQDLSKTEICQSNNHYAMFGTDATVENISWSQDSIINSCEESLIEKVRESMVGMSTLEMGGPIILIIMLDIIMEVDDSALRALTESLQNIRMKDIKGENVGTIASYLKGALLLLQNYGKLTTDTISVLRGIFYFAECDEFTTFISNLYFNH